MPEYSSNLIWSFLFMLYCALRDVSRRAIKGFPTHSTFSTLEAFNSVTDKDVGKATLAKDLAFLVDEFSNLDETKPKTRVELNRLLELRIKKRVKEQYIDGKFQDLMHKVVANPETLRNAMILLE
ncbi:hypothetical protein RHSIM_Rhsim10G0133200 [Rhododendron simsii]|uniref:Uncharacterized protein n=1 Tax=Rhododendron simsii TaxID=118357 RepID=A0A834L9L6_RHOSS|nr:hypothetical protein RHSIM_Rhsim10G0133200 [Rhododendron simsii]